MIRRMKSEVLPQLPSKQRKMVILDPNLVKSKSNIMKNQAKQYKNDKSMSSTERRGVLLEWYHTTSGAKSRAVCDYVKVKFRFFDCGPSINDVQPFLVILTFIALRVLTSASLIFFQMSYKFR